MVGRCFTWMFPNPILRSSLPHKPLSLMVAYDRDFVELSLNVEAIFGIVACIVHENDLFQQMSG